MSPHAHLACVLLLASPIVAQVEFRATNVSPVTVVTLGPASAVDFTTIPAGPLAAPFNESVRGSLGAWAYVQAAVDVGATDHASSAAGAELTVGSWARTFHVPGGAAIVPPHATDVEVVITSPIDADLEVSFEGSTTSNATNYAAVDFGADGSIDFDSSSPTPLGFPMPTIATSFLVRIHTAASVNGDLEDASSRVTLRVMPRRSAEQITPGCWGFAHQPSVGLYLDGRVSVGHIDIIQTSVGVLRALVIGTQVVSLPVPIPARFGDCRLEPRPDIVVPFGPTDTLGAYSMVLPPFGAPATPFDLYLQTVRLDVGEGLIDLGGMQRVTYR